ncbi:DUF5329 family protein [Vibrio splendidus]|uniref:DUF5329 family protein n=1 Tax=Vibrio splendidus TaxID=29497 RepID=UPI00036DAEB0|nr:DUF5329 family protein [Vibrio splendidus]MDP2589504.1 DUF5329 family protein [Vibrio splendidus]OEE55171.1 hypothetical protein A146_19220 [Vibrio splendidus FF-500]
MVKRTRFLCGLMVSQLLSLNYAFASPQQEIDHLLTFVESTQCKYERNGTIHNGPEAAAHIKKKADYYADDIESAEDFIAYSATKSMLSGRHYRVHCEGKASVSSEVWLKSELDDFRSR